MKRSIIYIAFMSMAVLTMWYLLNMQPRSTYSELERRELSTFPTLTWQSLTSGDFTRGVSSWYSDTEPFRDLYMMLSMDLRKRRAIHIGEEEEQITYLAGTDTDPESSMPDEMLLDLEADSLTPDSLPLPMSGEEQNGKITNSGILIVGSAPTARALMAYHGKGGGEGYARVVNKYKETFGDAVNIYCMIIPSAIEFYCPERAKSTICSEEATIENAYASLLPSVHPVRLIPVLSQHTDEAIYLRTDHHWSPRGAYYAAQELARVAGVPVPDLNDFDEHVTHNFVGTMYGFSQDISIKQSPEDFYYWTPRDVTYTVTYTVYDIDEQYRVIGEHAPYQSKKFFFHFRDGSGSAYCTFMGGDTKITRVSTSTRNGRRLLILKDSYGNALPGYLFGSFEEVHIVDGRYFTKNMVDYVEANHITDIVFANNVFKAYAGGGNYARFLTQRGSCIYIPEPDPADSLSSTPRESKDSASMVVTPSIEEPSDQLTGNQEEAAPADDATSSATSSSQAPVSVEAQNTTNPGSLPVD